MTPSQWTPGIDVSHYQGVIRWDQVKASGIEFAYIKVSDGVNWIDRDFSWNWKQSKVSGIARGVYHFYRPQDQVAAQMSNFEHCMRMMLASDPYSGELPPALDLEVGPMDSAELNQALVFLQLLEQYAGLVPVLYLDLANEGKIDGRFARYPLWLADYSGKIPITHNFEPWTFWQHTPAGSVEGISGQVDLDWFNGSVEDLRNVGKLPT